MKKPDVVSSILGGRLFAVPQKTVGTAFAPTNIALCKYWGKRNAELNLPVTSSLSISLGQKGARCTLGFTEATQDSLVLNGKAMAINSSFGRRVTTFLNLFRTLEKQHFHVDLQLNIPFAAGLASSACGFAALVLALNDFFGWDLKGRELSILARLGSGSACRSIFPGFVEWRAGSQENGMDSFGEPLTEVWPGFSVGLVLVSEKEKPLASGAAMARTIATSALYAAWPAKVGNDLSALRQAIYKQDFQLLGATAESNALTMHALMLSAWPPISYALPETITAMQKVWQLRHEGLAVYFTQDAGPNLKLLFLRQDAVVLQRHFPGMEIISPEFVISQ